MHCQAGAKKLFVVIVAAEMMLCTRTNVLNVVYHCRQQGGDTFLRNASFQDELVSLVATAEGLLGGPETWSFGGCIVKTRMNDQQKLASLISLHQLGFESGINSASKSMQLRTDICIRLLIASRC